MPDQQEPCPCAPEGGREDTPINQWVMIQLYREDQLRMEKRLARAELRTAQLEIRLSQLEGKPVKGWKVKRSRPGSNGKNTRGR